MKCGSKRLRTGQDCRNYCREGYLYCNIHMRSNILRIQRWWRNRIWLQKLNSQNRNDFCSLESIWVIEPKDWLSWVHQGRRFSCDKQSMVDWLKSSKMNPYTNEELTENEIIFIRRQLDNVVVTEEINWQNGSLYDLIIYFCGKLTELDYYGNPQWFINLEIHQWVEWFREMDQCIRTIPSDTLCRVGVNDMASFGELWQLGSDREERKRQVMMGCIQMVISGETIDDKKLGALWVIQSLGKVIEGIPGTLLESTRNSPELLEFDERLFVLGIQALLRNLRR